MERKLSRSMRDFMLQNMTIIQLILLGLALAYPKVGEPARLPRTVTSYQENEVIISKNAPGSELAFSTPELLTKIAVCESGGKHFEKNGDLLVGKYNPHDLGKYQINALYWKKKADELGYDLFTEAGNEAMARWLYRQYGTSPWKQSERCWKA